MTTKFVPMGDRVLVRRQTAEARSPGGLIIPENAREKPLRGEVLAVGPGRLCDDGTTRVPVAVSPGDVVLIERHAGGETRVDGEDLWIVRESQILGVVTEA